MELSVNFTINTLILERREDTLRDGLGIATFAAGRATRGIRILKSG